MTDERSFPRHPNEPLQSSSPVHEHGNDHSQSRDRHARRDGERSYSPRGGEEAAHSYGDRYGRKSPSGSSYGSDGQQSELNQRDDQNGGGGFPSSSRSSDEGDEQRLGQSQRSGGQGTGAQGPYGNGRYEQDRGGLRGGMPSNPPSQGVGGSTFGGYRSHGPHSGKGPKGYKRADEQICDEANQALERDGRVDASEIEVTCNGGVGKLTGKVENRAAKRDAEACVEDIYGVSDVMNELKVRNGLFATLFGAGSHSDNEDRRSVSESSNDSVQNNV